MLYDMIVVEEMIYFILQVMIIDKILVKHQ